MNATAGSLIYITDPKDGKKRPHMCICVFTNNAGIKYDWLVVPITSTTTIGANNLVKVEHPKLKIPSYAKINNVRTVTTEDSFDVSTILFDEVFLKEVTTKLQFVLKG